MCKPDGKTSIFHLYLACGQTGLNYQETFEYIFL